MILISAASHWATGITVRWREYGGTHDGADFSGWAGSVDFFDDGFCDDDPDTGQISTQGSLRTRYTVRDGEQATGLAAVIDALIADAARLGIEWRDGPALYYEGDGESKDFPAPAGWRELLREQAQRIGWSTYGYEPAGTGDVLIRGA